MSSSTPPAHALVRLGNPVLRKQAKRVSRAYLKTKEFKDLIRQMLKIMRKADGVGIAAPQIGVPLQIAILEMRPTELRPEFTQRGPLIIVNPRVLSYGKVLMKDWEGCLSFIQLRGQVERSQSVNVEYMNEEGELIEETLNGLWGRIFQHETDHLNGMVYVDRMEGMKSLMLLEEYKERVVRKNG